MTWGMVTEAAGAVRSLVKRPVWSAADRRTLLATASVAVVVALIAGYVPARTASRLDPVLTLPSD